MASFLKKINFPLGVFLSCCTFSSGCFSLSSNFILMPPRPQPTFVEFRVPQKPSGENPVPSENPKSPSDSCQNLFSFYTNSNSTTPKTVFKKNNQLFLNRGQKSLELLGSFLPKENKALSQMENSVSQAKLLVGFKNKFHQPVALVENNTGLLFAVTKLSKQHYSIEPLGTLTPEY